MRAAAHKVQNQRHRASVLKFPQSRPVTPVGRAGPRAPCKGMEFDFDFACLTAVSITDDSGKEVCLSEGRRLIESSWDVGCSSFAILAARMVSSILPGRTYNLVMSSQEFGTQWYNITQGIVTRVHSGGPVLRGSCQTRELEHSLRELFNAMIEGRGKSDPGGGYFFLKLCQV